MPSAEATTAILQLRALLLADAYIDPAQARQLVETAASRMNDPGSAMELVETFLYLLGLDPADCGNLHNGEDPKTEALAILDVIEVDTRRNRRRGWFSR